MDDEKIIRLISSGEYPNVEHEIINNEDNNYLQYKLNLINEQIDARQENSPMIDNNK